MSTTLIGGCLLVIYCLYQVCWYFPKWIRKLLFGDDVTKIGKQLPLAQKIAHRGSREEGLPENSLAAFHDAFNNGADVIELDVWLTSDEEVVIHHDETLHRMTGVNTKVTEVPYDSLPTISAKLSRQSERVNLFSGDLTSKIPKLEEVFAMIPEGKGVIIEFKQDSWLLIEKVHKLIQKYKMEKQVFWFSLVEKINKNLLRYDPSLPTITSVIGMLQVLFYYYIGFLPFIKLENQVFGITVEEITLQKIRQEKAIHQVPDWVKQILAVIFQGRPSYMMVSPKLFAHLRQRGVPVFFLGVNTEEDLATAIQAGATGVLTDRIAWLNNTLKTKGWCFKKLYE